jgi:hypothetical protein
MGVVRFLVLSLLFGRYRVVVFVGFLNRHPSAWYARFLEQQLYVVSISTRRQRRRAGHVSMTGSSRSTFYKL